MTDAMTAEKLSEIAGRMKAATEGPWERDYGGTPGHIKSLGWPERDGMKPSPTVARYDIWHGYHHDEKLREAATKMGHTEAQEIANGEFIAHARTDIPWLHAELTAAMEKMEAYRKAVVWIYENGLENSRPDWVRTAISNAFEPVREARRQADRAAASQADSARQPATGAKG